jgi:hypothetical protein
VFVSEKLRNLKKLPQKLPQIKIDPLVGGWFCALPIASLAT